MVNSYLDLVTGSKSTHGTLVYRHLPCCIKEGCGSSDAMCIYSDEKGFNAYCFSCSQSQRKGFTEGFVAEYVSKYSGKVKTILNGSQEVKSKKDTNFKMDNTQVVDSMTKGSIRPLTDRGIRESVVKKFGVRSKVKKVDDVEEIAMHVYPYFDVHNKLIAQHVRKVEGKKFWWEAADVEDKDFLDKVMLFGQHLFNPGMSTKLTITEGECDAMAAYQMNGELYPVVSVPSGAESVKKIFKNQDVYKWVDSFKEIVISMDNDDQGKKAAKILAEIFPKKSKVMNMRYKDANEYLANNAANEWTKDFHNAQSYAPEGLVKSSELIRPLVEGEAIETIAFYPYKALNRLLMGIRTGELVTVTAGTGVGKSAFINELAYSIQSQTGRPVGLLCLEQSKVKTAAKLLSLAMEKPLVNMNVLDKMPLYLKESEYFDDLCVYMKETGAAEAVDQQEIEDAANKLLSDDKFIIFDHFGSSDIDTIIRKVYQMVSVYECQTVFLDHISIIVSSGDQGDERKALDAIMTKLRMLVEQTGICLFVVSHLKRPQGKGHEEGAATSLSELRGTAGIGQLSDAVIGLERNQQHDDPWLRNCTLTRVLKNRMFGETGPASVLYFDKGKARFKDVPQIDYDTRMENFGKQNKDKENEAKFSNQPWTD
jgi:twinkle protein